MSGKRFGPTRTGSLVAPVAGIDPDFLRDLLTGRHGLPKRLRGHKSLDSFLMAVADLCAAHAATCDAVSPATPKELKRSLAKPATPKELKRRLAKPATPKELKRSLAKLEAAAGRMQAALAPMRAGSGCPELFELVESRYWYLAHRARSPQSDEDDRPQVPALVAALPPTLGELLAQVDDGLAALRIVSEYVSAKITPSAAVEKDRERALARALALAHLQAFGTLPPAGGWWRAFSQELGGRLGWDIGHAVVSWAIDSLQPDKAPPPD